MLTPIELAIADVERWLEALDRERDRASKVLGLLKGVRHETSLLLQQRPRRILPKVVFDMVKMAMDQKKPAVKRGA